jgi:hypothetical protein
MKKVFILDATIEKPDGSVEQLSAKEAQVLMRPDGQKMLDITVALAKGDGTVTISWIEGQPGQILNVLLGYPYFETEDTSQALPHMAEDD